MMSTAALDEDFRTAVDDAAIGSLSWSVVNSHLRDSVQLVITILAIRVRREDLPTGPVVM